MDRPRTSKGGCIASDKMAAVMAELLGGKTVGRVVLTRSQEQAMYKLYGFDPKQSTNTLEEAGCFRNMTRHAETDGMRIVAFLAEFCEPNEDPMRMIRVLMSEAGYDVTLEEEDLEGDFDDDN